MASIKIPTSFNIDVEFEVPEFYRRLLALLIDLLLEILYFILYIKILNSLSRDSWYRDDEYINVVAVLLFLPIMFYHFVMEITMNGQSVGKKILGIRVVNENGGRASLSQFTIRWLLRVSDTWIVVLIIILLINVSEGRNPLSFVVILGLLFLITDIILVISTPRGQRIGDVLAKTILIRTHSRSSIEETVFQEVASDYQVVYPAIMRLSDKDINAIKTILETARRKNDWTIAETAAEKIKGHLQIQTYQDPIDFLDTLLKDYNYLSVK